MAQIISSATVMLIKKLYKIQTVHYICPMKLNYE